MSKPFKALRNETDFGSVVPKPWARTSESPDRSHPNGIRNLTTCGRGCLFADGQYDSDCRNGAKIMEEAICAPIDFETFNLTPVAAASILFQEQHMPLPFQPLDPMANLGRGDL